MIIPCHLRLRPSGVLIHEERFGKIGIELRPVKSSGIRALALIITTSNPGGAAHRGATAYDSGSGHCPYC